MNNLLENSPASSVTVRRTEMQKTEYLENGLDVKKGDDCSFAAFKSCVTTQLPNTYYVKCSNSPSFCSWLCLTPRGLVAH